MPIAGDEGYEKLVICPYDQSHEIRMGRMQFHLEKCRRNFPLSPLEQCPYNSLHLIHGSEMKFHIEEDCVDSPTWEKFTHQVESNQCSVADLVPVNAATVPDGGENWDDFEANGSVLQHIKTEAENRPIIRHKQVASKAERKNFRQQERRRFQEMNQNQGISARAEPDTASIISVPLPSNEPLPKPRVQPKTVPIKKDLTKEVAIMSKHFRTLDINMKSPTADVPPSETSSMINGPPSEFAASTSAKLPISYAAASRPSTSHSQPSREKVLVPSVRPGSALSNVSTPSTAVSMKPTFTHVPVDDSGFSRPATAMSNTSYSSYATASQGAANRSPSVLSTASFASVRTSRPPNSTAGRPSTASNIASSLASINNQRRPADDEGFSQIPIPGLGRGRRAPKPL